MSIVEELRALNDGVSRPVSILERECCGRAADKITELEWLLREFQGHEGAEGWSKYLRERIDAYTFETREEDHVGGG